MADQPFADSSALVTGAAGFIGSHVVRRLLAEGARVTGVGRAETPGHRLADVAGQLRWIGADLRDRAAATRAVDAARPDFVFHLAGFAAGRSADAARQSRLLFESYETNVLGTLNLLTAVQQAAPRVRRIARLGTLEEYGDGPVPYREEQREAPVSPYSSSQVAATYLCSMLHQRAGLPVVTLRPALMYGPGQDESFFIPGLIASCLANETFAMTSGGQTRDYLYIADLVDACLAAATAPAAAGEVLNIGSGIEYRIADVATLIGSLAGSGAVSVGSRPERERGLERLVCDPARAERVLGWHALVSLEQGLTATIEWFRANPARRATVANG